MAMTIGEVARRAGVAPTTLRYYEQIGLLTATQRVGGQRRYDESALSRLEVIRMCKIAGFSLEEIAVLFADDEPGRPASRALAQAKLAEIDSQMALLARAREVVEWGMACTCPSIDACTCGIHRPAAHIAN
ncbi:MAG TPA: MerR family transcriptional regulator [Mycobacterium sp.]|nr:MerR family transcriptional regulator [Mycobacterium sp.]